LTSGSRQLPQRARRTRAEVNPRKNGGVSDAGDFVDAALQREGSWSRAEEQKERIGGELRFYGASVGAVRGTIRDVGLRYPGLSHDEITALSSELWAEPSSASPVFERRLAAVVLLQTNLRILNNSDLTRIEGFVRSARLSALVDPLAVDVLAPLIAGLDPHHRARADIVLERWEQDEDPWIQDCLRQVRERILLVDELRQVSGRLRRS
jgi:hypothetical protein